MSKTMKAGNLTLYCFTPLVTLATFIIELTLALYALVTYRRTPFGKLSAVLLFLLGIFQLSEYMICHDEAVRLWIQAGWISITFIPAIGIHLASFITGHRRLIVPAYVLAGVFSLVFVVTPTVLTNVSCTGNYVSFTASSPALHIVYSAYYFGMLFIPMVQMAQLGWKAGKKRELIKWCLIGYGSFMIPTFVVYALWRAPWESFPSVFCGFALFMALIAVGKILPLYHHR